MKHFFTVFGIGLLTLWSTSALADTPVDLGTASSFAVLAGSAITNTGASLINGDLGLSPETAVTGFPPGTLNGTQYIAEAVALQAQNDLTTAYNDAAGRPPVLIATELGNEVVIPGAYYSASGTFEITGTLTLDGENDPNSVFVFQMESSLNTAGSSRVDLIRGAQACNVFWQVGSSATLGTYSDFSGNILALTSITVTTGTVIDGRVLARNGAVTLDADTISCATCPCIPDEQVRLFPNNPDFPGAQEVYACAQLTANTFTQVVVPVPGPGNVPIVNILPGCFDCGDEGCEPLSSWVLGDWTFTDVGGELAYVASLTAGDNVDGCCVCISLDYVLPVELTGFDAVAGDEEITLHWSTASETNNDYFDVLRDGVTMSSIDAANSATGYSYTWADLNLTNGREYTYNLVAVSLNGTRETVGTVSATPAMNEATVTEYALHQNYPNPFNPETNIMFDLVEASDVRLTIFNPLGQAVSTLVNGTMNSGRHTVTFDGSRYTSGLYYYRLEAGNFTAIRKMVLMK